MELTADKVTETLKAVVAESPDKVYAAPAHMVTVDYDGKPVGMTCFYVHKDESGEQTCGCLVGVVLNRLGVPLETLATYEGTGADGVGSALGLDEDTRTLLTIAQSAQDNGATWGDALARALAGDGAEL